ncbi:hypothetical protein PTKIN_Ptkin15bG0151700 [Pterospermum kingtungense]
MKKMVVKLTLNGDKSRTKALQIAVGFSGVESASLKGDDKSQIEVTGDGVDPVKLTSRLRKSMGHAELVSVSDAGGEKKEEKKVEVMPTPLDQVYVWQPHSYQPCYVYPEPSYGPTCSIM